MGNFKRGVLLAIAGSVLLTACGKDPDTVGTPDIELKLSANSITVGQAAGLQWSAQNAFTCAASGTWQGARDVLGGESTGPITVPGTYAYTLSCSGPKGTESVTKTLTVVPGPGPSVWLTAQPQAVVQGQSVKLTWTSTNVQSCSVSGSWTGARSTSGTENTGTLATSGSFVYAISCLGLNGQTASDSETVFVGEVDAPTVSLNLASTSLVAGQSTQLSWSSSNATSCTTIGAAWLNPGTRPTKSSAPESTGALGAGTYVYTLSCTGPGGTTSSSPRTLQVNPPTATPSTSISVNPSTVGLNAPATLTWSSSTGVSGDCTANNAWTGSKPASGTEPVSHGVVGEYVYELTCPGVAKQSAKLKVVDTTAPTFTTAFTASPDEVTVGQPITLKWATNNAANCAISGGLSGGRGASGTEVFFPTVPGIVSFALTCTGPGGSVVGTDAVTVKSGGTAPVISFNCTDGNTAYVIPEAANGSGGTTKLCWTVLPNLPAEVNCKAYGDWAGDKNLSGTADLGPFTVPGAYNYALQCKNSDTGETTLATQQVTVTPRTTAQPSVTLYASPSTVLFGNTTRLDWTSNNTVSCEASGDPGWTGPKAINSFQETVASRTKSFPGAPSIHHYVIKCSDGKASPSFARYGVVVEAKGPAASISLTAIPPTVTTGGTSTLQWTTQGVEQCTAKGEWSGSKTISGTFNTGALTQVRTYIYGLECTGPGGRAEVFTNVTVTAPAAPTIVFFETNTPVVNPSPDGIVRLRWSSTNATGCTASGSFGPGWTGAKNASSNGYIEIPAPPSVGTYTYNLSCSGAGGSVDAQPLSIQVVQPCGLLNNAITNVPNKALLAPSSSVTSSIDSVLCLGCNVADQQNVLTSDQSDFALINLPVGLIASAELTTTDNSTVYPAGRRFGYIVSVPSSLLSAELLKDLSLTTYLNGAEQESFPVPELLDLDLLGLLNDPTAYFLNATASKPFNGVQITKSAVLSVFPQTYVYGACVVLPASVAPTPPL